MSTKQEKIDFISKLHKCLEDGSDAAIDEVFAQDFKMIVPGTNGRKAEDLPLPDGIEGPRAFVALLKKGFSNIKWEIQKAIPEDDGGEDIIACRGEWSGDHTGEFMGIPATGRHIVVRFAAFDRVIGGKMVSGEIIQDTVSLLIQLGVMEPPKGF